MFPDVALLYLLYYLFHSSAENLKVRLYTNNYTPVAGTVLASLTEATNTNIPGYAAKTGVAFPDPTINGSGQGESDGPTMTWTATSNPPAAIQVFGLYVTITGLDSVDHLIFAAKFGSPVTFAFSGDFCSKKLNWFDANFTP